MHRIRSKVVIFFCSFVFLLILFALPALANNPPDSGHSSLSASNQAPADGQSTINVTVTLQDSSGNPLSGDTVTFSDPSDSTAVFNPTSATLDSSGQTTFTITSTTVGTDNISVTDTSSNTSLNNLGQVTFTPVATPTPSSSCTDQAPGSTPQLASAVANNSSQITLTWVDATDPVSYYLIAYGVASGQYIYGNPNVGGQGTTTYTIGSLSPGKTYYFVVEAVNGCMPGSYSNELSQATESITPTTPTTQSTQNSNQGSINAQTTPTPTDTPTPSPTPPKTPPKTASLSIDKKEGIGIAVIILAVIGLLTFIFLKKRRNRRSEPPKPESKTDNQLTDMPKNEQVTNNTTQIG